ncbi:hypothetical protein Q4574_21430 [Aliiglaciecola sp. 3_MG-2023]|uniref:hypothetical protein n=1 Tax=unclassified Aliiglaciecola TaxID=2593648 RepID=UPI0026E23B00|nr:MULTISPECIES: hypothetical protein [unclassified Aliiglaciecola]MDO6695865.1 hypothetical protein [Aliiglaciecola sp. 3_MG-2023]MDO6713362.1 hypothetical protein [Aliiglaciecola sp. 2_MG-2023]MDO6754482.1 hypothetical protein [Aliiglaciecola sp. 1_MG-2023]
MFRVLVFLILVLAICAPSYSVPLNTTTESTIRQNLEKHALDFEHVISFAIENQLEVVQWVDGRNGERASVKSIIKKGSRNYIEITDSSLDELTEFLLSENIDVIWLQHFDGIWLIRKAFTFKHNDREQEGFYTFGEPTDKGLCKLSDESEDYGNYQKVTGEWYIAKCQYPSTSGT